MPRFKSTQYEYEGMPMIAESYPPEYLDRIKDTLFDDKDILIATYPKCGTTWMQEIVYQVFTEGDFEGSNEIPVFKRFHYLERSSSDNTIDKCLAKPSPRLMKTHLSSSFFKKTLDEKKMKVIVVLRNPKDMLVSYYNFYRMASFPFDHDGKWEEFFERFKKDKLIWGCYFDMQLSWWAFRNDPRVLICKFEDMLKDPKGVVCQVAEHLNKKLSDDLVKKIVELTSFKSMKENPMLNYSSFNDMDQAISPFMRKGGVGDWKNYFTDEQRDYVDNLSKLRFEPEGLFLEDG